MATLQKTTICGSAELSIGDDIETWRNGMLLDRGRVSRALSSVDMVWIVSARTGALTLIDMAAADVVRIGVEPTGVLPAPAPLCSSGSSRREFGIGGRTACGASTPSVRGKVRCA